MGKGNFHQEAYVSDCVSVPSAVKDRLRAIDNAFFRCQRVDCVRPEMCDQLYNSSRTSNDAVMRAVIHSKLEGAQFGLGYTTFTLLSALLEQISQESPTKR
jgi:hypothetical protein